MPVRADRLSTRICHPGVTHSGLIASNSDGAWNESAAKLDFSIAPAYYQTNWFRAFCAALLLLLAWAGYRLRIRQLHGQFEMTLDARVAERTRIARDLHDTLLQSFHGLLLRFQTALNLLPDRPGRIEAGPCERHRSGSRGDYGGPRRGARSADLGDRDERSGRCDSCARRRAGGQRLGWGVLRFEVQGTPRALHPIVRDEVFRIAGEALRNAFRHAAARAD